MSENGDTEAPAAPEVTEQQEEQPAAPDSTQEQVEPQDSPQAEPEADSNTEAEAKEPEASPPEEQPAAAEPEAEKPEEGEKAEDKGEEEGKTEEAEPEPEVEEKPAEEEPIVITPEGNPHWLSTEDVLAKNLPESEVENFKNFYFKHAHSLQVHYDALKECCVQTEYITLSKEEIDALTVEGDLSEEQQQCLNGLRDRINSAMELYEGDGALVKINGRSAKDAYLDKTEEMFVQAMRDEVINSLEIEKQSICAYSIWKDQEHHPGAFKRGMNKIRASFRRSRAGSAGGGRRRPKLEEEKKDEAEDEEAKPEEAKPEGEEKKEGEGEQEAAEEPKPAAEGEEAATKDEAPAAEGEGEGEAAATEVTVQADVENDDSKPEEAAPKEEEPKEEAAAAAEPPKEEEEEPKAEPEAAEEPPKQEEDDKKEEVKADGEDKKEDGEIQAAPAEEEEGKEGEEVKSKHERKASKKKQKSEEHHHHHQHKAAKSEPLDNRVLRAFGRAMGTKYEVKDGQAALDQLRSSTQIRRDLNKLKAFGGVEGVQVSVSVCRWQSQIPAHTGMIFRGFVYNNELWALSQYNDTVYFPNVDHYKDKVITGKIQNFFQENVKEPLNELNNYIVDFFVAPDKMYVIRLNPFYTTVGACLFTWNDGRVLTKGPFEFRIVDAPKMAPEAYSSYQSCWQDMLNSVLQQRKTETRPPRGGPCVIL